MKRWEFLFKYNSTDCQSDGNTENLVGLTYYPIGYCSHPVALPSQNEVLPMAALPIYFVRPQASLVKDRVCYNDFNFNLKLFVDIPKEDKVDDWQLRKFTNVSEVGEILIPSSIMMWDNTAEYSYMITEPYVYVFENKNRNQAVMFDYKEKGTK